MARFTDVGLWNLIEHDEVLKGYVGGAFADFRKLDDGVLLGYGSQGPACGGGRTQCACGGCAGA